MFARFLRHGGWLLLLPLFVIAAAMNAALDSRAAAARLASAGVEASATITEKYERRSMAPVRRADLLEPQHLLRFSYRSGSVMQGNFHVGLGEAKVSKAFFDRMEPGSTAPLRYLPEDDSVFELEPGTHEREARQVLEVAALIAVLSLPLAWIVLRKAATGAAQP